MKSALNKYLLLTIIASASLMLSNCNHNCKKDDEKSPAAHAAECPKCCQQRMSREKKEAPLMPIVISGIIIDMKSTAPITKAPVVMNVVDDHGNFLPKRSVIFFAKDSYNVDITSAFRPVRITAINKDGRIFKSEADKGEMIEDIYYDDIPADNKPMVDIVFMTPDNKPIQACPYTVSLSPEAMPKGDQGIDPATGRVKFTGLQVDTTYTITYTDTTSGGQFSKYFTVDHGDNGNTLYGFTFIPSDQMKAAAAHKKY